MKRRIFVAVPVSEKLQNEILAWEGGSRDLPVRWLAGKNLHVTLVPPWYEDNIERAKALIGGALGKFKPFEIIFERVAYGPDPRSPRLIWAEGRVPQGLAALHGGLANALGATLGFEPEARPFRLHLTLARFRPEDFRAFPAKELDEKVRWQETVNSITLMESHLSSAGADYEVLERWSCG